MSMLSVRGARDGIVEGRIGLGVQNGGGDVV